MTRDQPFVDVGQALGVGVAGQHDVALLGQQRFEGVEELFLRALLVGEKLHVVDQQQVERVVTLLELVEGLALVGLDHIGNELFGVDVENLGLWTVGQQVVADGVHQVGLAQADAAVNEQRVVELAQAAGHVHCSGARHAVGRTFHQRGKGQRGVQPGLGAAGCRHLGRRQIRQFGQHLVLYRAGRR
jgi:hypothetical protein